MKTLIVRLSDEAAARLLRAVPAAKKWVVDSQPADARIPGHADVEQLLQVGLDAADVEAEASAQFEEPRPAEGRAPR